MISPSNGQTQPEGDPHPHPVGTTALEKNQCRGGGPRGRCRARHEVGVGISPSLNPLASLSITGVETEMSEWYCCEPHFRARDGVAQWPLWGMAGHGTQVCLAQGLHSAPPQKAASRRGTGLPPPPPHIATALFTLLICHGCGR